MPTIVYRQFLSMATGLMTEYSRRYRPTELTDVEVVSNSQEANDLGNERKFGERS